MYNYGFLQVTGEGTNRQREKIQRQREAVPITEVGSQCKLTFKMPGERKSRGSPASESPDPFLNLFFQTSGETFQSPDLLIFPTLLK